MTTWWGNLGMLGGLSDLKKKQQLEGLGAGQGEVMTTEAQQQRRSEREAARKPSRKEQRWERNRGIERALGGPEGYLHDKTGEGAWLNYFLPDVARFRQQRFQNEVGQLETMAENRRAESAATLKEELDREAAIRAQNEGLAKLAPDAAGIEALIGQPGYENASPGVNYIDYPERSVQGLREKMGEKRMGQGEKMGALEEMLLGKRPEMALEPEYDPGQRTSITNSLLGIGVVPPPGDAGLRGAVLPSQEEMDRRKAAQLQRAEGIRTGAAIDRARRLKEAGLGGKAGPDLSGLSQSARVLYQNDVRQGEELAGRSLTEEEKNQILSDIIVEEATRIRSSRSESTDWLGGGS